MYFLQQGIPFYMRVETTQTADTRTHSQTQRQLLRLG